MDGVLNKLPQEDSITGQFGQEAEVFARSVAAARETCRTDPQEFRARAAWRLDPRVLAVLITLEEDR